VHKYKNWSVEFKNIYDMHPSLKVVFTSSALLEMLNSRSDLSRRALIYEMQGMSYREYLNFNLGADFSAISLEEILENHTEIALQIKQKIKPLKEFEKYLEVGYFPFYQGNKEWYYKRLGQIIDMIVEIELPLLRSTDVAIISKIRQLIYVISQSVPFKPNISSLANKIQITRKTLLEYLNHLNDANVFTSLYKNSHGISLLQKPEKLFLENTNYMSAIMGEKPNISSLRETFFLNQLSVKYKLTYPDRGDFLVAEKYLFEVGGKGKSAKQITGVKNAFIASDDIEIGYENKIPLWLFGFLY